MNLKAKTTNGQEGDQSVETIEVYDGDNLISTTTKRGSQPATTIVVTTTDPIVAVEPDLPPFLSASKRLKVGD